MEDNLFLCFLNSCFLYLIGHFLLYVFFFRKFLRQEKTVFLYHFVSFVLFTVVVCAVSFLHVKVSAFETIFCFSCLHGIYSLSFLELWSLSQGSYSLTILNDFQQNGAVHRDSLIEKFTQLGEEKKNNRLEAIEEMGLIILKNDVWHVTPKGLWLSKFFRGLLFLANFKNSG